MTDLLEGYRRFRETEWPRLRARYERLARRGQSPHTLVVAGSDSRVDPEDIFSAGPGDLFVIRNVGSIVPPYRPDRGYHGTSAALEFGICILKIPRIVVLGHSGCGGVKALVEGAPAQARDFLDPWLSIVEPVLWPTPEGFEERRLYDHFERAVVRESLANLLTFPWIAHRIRSGTLEILGFRFVIATGELEPISAPTVDTPQAGAASRRFSR